ncbi:MAG: penicillin-binding protein [Bacteroidota bacterium]
MRMYLVYICTGIFALIVLFKVGHIQFAEGDMWKEKEQNRTRKFIRIEANRGDIYSDDGSLIATTIPKYTIYMDLGTSALKDEIFNENIDSLAYCLAQCYNGLVKDRTGNYESSKSAKTYKRNIINARKKKIRYYKINDIKIGYLDLIKMRKFPIFRLGRNKGGFIPVRDTSNSRESIFGILANRTIGYVNNNSGAKIGLEGGFDSYLKGSSGFCLMQKIGGNNWMPLNDENEMEPKDGNDLISTIDINLQDVAEHALMKQLDSVDADHGSVVLMEVETGEIKAIANLKRTKDGSYKEIYNFAIGESTEPGSTFKLASLICAMEDGYVDLDDMVDTENGKTHYYGKEMKDSHEGGYGRISVKKVFEVSSNVGVSKIIFKNYAKNPKQYTDRLYKMGLGTPLNLNIPGEGFPIVKTPKNTSWSGTTLPWMSIGYEVQLTPLHILTFYNAVANNGKMIKPKFVKELRKDGKLVKTFETEIINPKICSQATIDMAKQMMEGVVSEGTAKNLKDFHVKIAGKTGTAQMNYKSKGVEAMKYQSSFVGYFPAEAPKYSCIVVINNPSAKGYYGSVIAGPIFKEIAEKVYSSRMEMHKELPLVKAPVGMNMKSGYLSDILFIAKGLNLDASKTYQDDAICTANLNGNYVSTKQVKIKDHYVPNVVGMSVKDALYMLENSGLRVLVKGFGTIVKQSIAPGTSFRKGQTITIELS